MADIATTVLERYMLRDVHQGEMALTARIRFRGSVDVTDMRRAWRHVVASHPRLSARVTGRGRLMRWQTDSIHDDSFESVAMPARTPLDAGGWRAPTRTHLSAIDPRRGPGARCRLVAMDTACWELTVSIHHACCDGVGIARVIAELMIAYQERTRTMPTTTKSSPATDAVEPPTLTSVSTATKIPAPRHVWATVKGRNIRLESDADECGPSAPAAVDGATLDIRDHCIRAVVAPNVTTGVRQRLRAERVSVNDFGTAVTLHTLASITSSAASSNRYLAIMNPVEMRQWHQRRRIENHLGFAFIRRRHDQLTRLDATITSVRQQLDYVRQNGIATEIITGMEAAEAIPFGMPLVERIGWFTPTAAWTCLSALRLGKRHGVRMMPSGPVVGDAIVEDLDVHGPLPSGTQLGIILSDAVGSFSIDFRATPGWSDPDRLRIIATRFCRHLIQYSHTDSLLDPSTHSIA